MNSRKFDFFGNMKYFSIASLVIMLAGLVIGLIFGFANSSSINGQAYLYSILAIIISILVLFIYCAIRHGFYSAFAFLLSSFHNIALLISLVVLFRIPVESGLLMALCLTIALTAVFEFITLSKLTPEMKITESRKTTTNDLVVKSLKQLIIIGLSIVVVLVLGLLIGGVSILNFVRPALLGTIISLYCAIFITTEYWGLYVKEKRKKKIEKDETVFIEKESENGKEISTPENAKQDI